MFALTYVEIDVPSFVEASPPETTTFRFAIPTAYLPADIDCIPSIDSVSFTPARVSLGEDLGQRASIRVNFRDHRHIFAGEPYDQGSFWGKWRGRYGTKLRGCALRVIRGILGQTIAEMDTRHYLVETTDGPTLDGVYLIEAKDVLKFADDDRAQAPVINHGRLAGSIDSSTTSATLAPAGIGNTDYPVSGYLCLGGKEVVAFTRSNDALTITRAQFGSIAQAHSSGDRVQEVLRYDGDDPADIIYDLLVNFAGVDASYIELAEWQAETADNLGVIYARTITEPTSVRTLLNELVEQAALILWWDDRAQRVRLSVLREIATDTDTFDEERIIAGSLKVREQPLSRISQVWTFYGERDPTDRGADQDNYRAALADVDLEAETEYGSAEIVQISAKWVETEAAASRLNAIKLSRFRDPPRLFEFDLVTGEQIALATGYTLEWWANQNSLGEVQPAKIQVTQVSIFSDRIHVEAEEMLATGDLPALVNVVFLTTMGSLLSWTVPDDWNDADNSFHCIGGGGGGGPFSGGGGGGGAYSAITNLDLTPAASVSYRVGAGGASGSSGSDTWFNGASLGASSVGAKAGTGGTSSSAGTGGQASAGVGTVKFSGGNGGTGGTEGGDDPGAGGGGGGGAAGPNGDGARGGNATGTLADTGRGGGGANGGFQGGDGGNVQATGGGNNRFNFGGGAGGPSSGQQGQSGTESGGGGGGGKYAIGGPGGAGEQLWTQTVNPIISAGPGGGGGGGGTDARGGKGGRYGGGGGGAGEDFSAGGEGEQGIIVIMWRSA